MRTHARKSVSTKRLPSDALGSDGLLEHWAPNGGIKTQECISIVVPVFNEGTRIERTIRAIFDYMAAKAWAHEIIIADDGSMDSTVEIVTKLQREALPIRLLRSERNWGKGNAVRRGTVASTGDFVLITDADLSTPLEELEKLLEQLRGGVDIAIGSRGLRDSQLIVRQPRYRELLGRVFNLLVQWTILPGIVDTQCGFKLFRGSVARKLFACATIDGFAFDVEVLGLAARASYRIAEVPVRWSHMSQSKVRLGRDGIAMFSDMIRVACRLRSDWYDLAALSLPSSETAPSVVQDKT